LPEGLDEQRQPSPVEHDTWPLGAATRPGWVELPRLVGHGPTLFAGLSKRVDLKLVSRLDVDRICSLRTDLQIVVVVTADQAVHRHGERPA
jgi:hypothetical protein